MRVFTGMPDHEVLYQIAEQQGGYFSAAQAIEAGFSYSLLSSHLRGGRFERVRPRIYRLVQFPASTHEDLHVASLQAGPDAVISHDSALALYRVLARRRGRGEPAGQAA